MALTTQDKAFIVDAIAQALVAYGAAQAKAPRSARAASTATPTPAQAAAQAKREKFVEDVIRKPRAHACTLGLCVKVFKTPARAAAHWHPAPTA